MVKLLDDLIDRLTAAIWAHDRDRTDRLAWATEAGYIGHSAEGPVTGGGLHVISRRVGRYRFPCLSAKRQKNIGVTREDLSRN